MKATKNPFLVGEWMGHANLKSMEDYQHPELATLRDAINERNRSSLYPARPLQRSCRNPRHSA